MTVPRVFGHHFPLLWYYALPAKKGKGLFLTADILFLLCRRWASKVTNYSKGAFNVCVEAERIAPSLKATSAYSHHFLLTITRVANARGRLSPKEKIGFLTSSGKKNKIDRSPKVYRFRPSVLRLFRWQTRTSQLTCILV